MRFFFFAILISIGVVASAQQFKVMSYNIRYKNVTDGINQWDNRKEKVAEIIKRADIAGLQEVLNVQIQDLKALLPAYDYVGVGRDNGKKKGEFSPIWYLKSKYSVVKWGTIWLSEKPDKKGSKGWDADLPRICTWARMKDKSSGTEFYVFNTHFDHKGKVARVESAKLAIEKIKEIAAGSPVLFVGDFNMTNETEGYKILMMKENGVNLRDAFYLVSTQGEVNTSYGFNVSKKDGKKIDYVFVSPQWKVMSHTIYTDNNGTSYPSDHLPVLAEVGL
ncbi:MAG: endonuclease/exonuclease/phosphatase family protein [Chitinophagales bacterium]|nr:endonuclease/exonuclease/phosphatase family protein [Chitinophagales bacterium]